MQENKRKISIITSVYNSVDTIERTIKSVIHQDYEKLQYIVVDGNSTDGTQNIIQKYRNRIDKYVSEKDNGVYDGFNKGVSMADGEIIYILNAGDYLIDEDVIRKVMNVFNNEDVEVVYGWMYGKDPLTNVMQKSKASFSIQNSRKGVQPPHPATFITRKVYDEVGLYDTKYRSSADFDLLCRVALGLYPSAFVDIPIAVFPYGGISSGKRSKIGDNETREIIKKYFGKAAALKYYSRIRSRRAFKSFLEKTRLLEIYQRLREKIRK